MPLRKPGIVCSEKVVADKPYLHIESISELGDTPDGVELRERISKAEKLADVRRGEDFNLVRVDSAGGSLGLLHYPDFSSDPFPSLVASWRVDLDAGTVGFRTYAGSLNPPILHRKELLLAASPQTRSRSGSAPPEPTPAAVPRSAPDASTTAGQLAPNPTPECSAIAGMRTLRRP